MEKRNSTRYGKCLSDAHLETILSNSINRLVDQVKWQREESNLCPYCGIPLTVTFDSSRKDMELTVYRCDCGYKNITKTYK